ncbi:PEP-CTERM sorting domain-containing protein [Tichowtungia aerotolerans]|uniref:PEP-CTERM sorting domain-containing protein n=1 Tax=Tichowtungia aerotolerans TaxID=2697043 RepID=A0A6P1M4K9_9BACT|nr:PEP-CTERM sorting domain-containing protein [Tichowtungia aerotolerans]QHI69729.1 PEP-CTERM sorting domain-containing protein [Tichowtungia aerotolerans]
MKLKWIIASIVLTGALCARADVILWDLNYDENAIYMATVDDFVALGVAGNLSGAAVSQVVASSTNSMSDGTITLSYSAGLAQSVSGPDGIVTNVDNGVLCDYLYLAAGGNEGPVTMQIAGLSSSLLSDTQYYLYLIGAGDNTNQGTSFTFDSATLDTVSGTGTPSDAVATFTFTTGSTVNDTLEFTWDRIGSNDYSGFNGFAIVAVPEPATIGLVGISGVLLFWGHRRSSAKKATA